MTKIIHFLIMIIMKKLFAIIAALTVTAFSFNAKAQLSGIEGMPPYKLGITVGMNMSNLSGSFPIDSNAEKIIRKDYEMTGGFQIGANLMVDASPLLPNTFARVETKYSMKGAKWQANSITEEITLHYIEIPIHYGYAWYINDNVSLMAETGPYLAVGFSGVSKQHNSEYHMKDVGVFDSGLGYHGNRFDLGWGVQGSAMVAKNFQIHVAYDFGFINVTNNYLQNRNLSVGLTWFFESLFE